LYVAPESGKTPQQHWAVVDVPSVCRHVRYYITLHSRFL